MDCEDEFVQSLYSTIELHATDNMNMNFVEIYELVANKRSVRECLTRERFTLPSDLDLWSDYRTYDYWTFCRYFFNFQYSGHAWGFSLMTSGTIGDFLDPLLPL